MPHGRQMTALILKPEHVATTAVFPGAVAASLVGVQSPAGTVRIARQLFLQFGRAFQEHDCEAARQHQIPQIKSGNTVTKDELRAELERQEQRYKDVYGGEITTYAAQPDPERKPWRKKASILDQAFKQELQKMEQELKEEH
jgi:hypothetical protein